MPGSRCPESLHRGIHNAATRLGPTPLFCAGSPGFDLLGRRLLDSLELRSVEPGPVSALTGNVMHSQNPRIPMREDRALHSAVMVVDLLIDRYGQIALNDGLMRRIAKVYWD